MPKEAWKTVFQRLSMRSSEKIINLKGISWNTETCNALMPILTTIMRREGAKITIDMEKTPFTPMQIITLEKAAGKGTKIDTEYSRQPAPLENGKQENV